MRTSQERLLEGKIRAAREGVWVVGGTPPYGYDVDPDTKRLVINEEEARVVRMMHQWLVEERLSIGHIQNRLNSLGIPTKFARLGREKKYNSGRWWSYGNVYYILSRTAYVGYHEWRGMRIPCPRIISDEVWVRGREQLARNRQGMSKLMGAKRENKGCLLEGLVHCGVCGRRFAITFGHEGRFYYTCSSRNPQHSEKPCGAPSLRGAVVDPLIWKMLTEYIQKPELLRGIREARRLEALQRELAFVDEALGAVADREGWMRSIDGTPALELAGTELQIPIPPTSEKPWLDAEQKRLSARKIEIAEEVARLEGHSPTEKQLEAFCGKVREGLEALDPKGRQELVALLIEKVVVTQKTVEAYVVFPVEGVAVTKTYLLT
jgi:site-specific DNA recombinase